MFFKTSLLSLTSLARRLSPSPALFCFLLVTFQPRWPDSQAEPDLYTYREAQREPMGSKRRRAGRWAWLPPKGLSAVLHAPRNGRSDTRCLLGLSPVTWPPPCTSYSENPRP